MKIILTQDVEKLGNAGSLQDVKPGFARNYLIPKGMAVAATAGMIKEAEARRAAEQRRIAKQEVVLQSLADRISGMRLEFTARAGEQGRLFGSVTNADIAERLSQEVGQEIDRRKVDLPNGIHEVGEFQVPIRLVGRLAPEITAVVVPEGGATTGATTPGRQRDLVSEPSETLAEQAGPGVEVDEEMSGLTGRLEDFEEETAREEREQG